MTNSGNAGAFPRIAAAVCVAIFASHIAAQSALQTPAQPAAGDVSADDMQPKFSWGLLISYAANKIGSAFISWAFEKLTTKLTAQALERIHLNGKSASIVPLDSLGTHAAFGAKSAGAAENAVAGEPSGTLKISAGRENYQGVHVAMIDFDRAGKGLGFHPLTAGFRSGERFKLRVLPTFDGLLVIENINPKGERRQIYPPKQGDVTIIKAGIEIMIPLGKEQYFEFTGATGDEQLVVTIRDPRAFGKGASTAIVNRRDENNGSNFLQEVQADTYPLISQGIRLRHD